MPIASTVQFNPKTFSIVNNYGKGPILYSTADTSYNALTFKIKNNTGVDLTLTGSEPKGVSASTFVFDFDKILDEKQAEAMHVKDAHEQWDAVYVAPAGRSNPAWRLTPKKDLAFKIDDEIVFTLENIVCTAQTPGNFDVSYANIPGVSARTFPFSYQMAVLNPPDHDKLNLKEVVNDGVVLNSVIHTIGNQAPAPPGTSGLPIQVDITYDNAFPIQNGFTLYLKNTSSKPLVPVDQPLGQAKVIISFLFADDDDDAITTQEKGDQIHIDIDAAKTEWRATEHLQGTANWEFIPKSKGVMDANETVKFVAGNLITPTDIKAKTLSSLHIQWNFIPGYNDGYYAIEMQKEAAVPSIPVSLNITPTTINYGENVKISYMSEVAAYLTLEYVRRDGTTITLQSPGDITYNETDFSPTAAPDKEATTFNLAVYRGPGQPAVQKQSFSITVKQPPATISSFTASSRLVNINDSGNTVTLNWVVENAKTVILLGVGVQTGNSYPAKIQNTITYTLQAIPWGSEGQTVQQSITIYAYKTFPSVAVGAMGNGTAFQSLPLSITNLEEDVIYVSNSGAANGAGQIYQVSKKTHAVSPTSIPATIMALSADGKRLIVAQAGGGGPGNILMYDTANPTGPVFSMQEPAPPPYSMAIDPTGKQLYYMQQHNLSSVSAFSVDETGNRLAYVKDIGVGKSPEAYGFDASGANLYVGNYDSSSVSVINLAQNTASAPIVLQSGEPCAFALAGTMMFVACSGDNRVCVIDTTSNKTLDPITAGNRPFGLALDQNRARLFVANLQDTKVTVIDTATRTVKANIPVGKGPSAIKITETGKLMFVSNYCDKSLTVVDISNGNEVVLGTLQMETSNGNPIDISTYPQNNSYTDVFVAKEYFIHRSDACQPSVSDPNLNMSIFSIQETPPSQRRTRKSGK